MKHPWLRVIGFMLLFYLIIRGVLYLMVSNVGGDNRSSGRQSKVYIIVSEVWGKRSVDELFVLLDKQQTFDVQIIEPAVFAALPVSPDAKIVVPPASGPDFWNYLGEPVITRLYEWIDTGSLVLTFSIVPKSTAHDKPMTLISQGYYQVKFSIPADSSVLWFDEIGACSSDIGEVVYATIHLGEHDFPVIGSSRLGRGRLITCLARPQVSAGAESLVSMLLNITDSVPFRAVNHSGLKPMIFDSLLIRQVNKQMQILLIGPPSSQVNAINRLTQYQYPMARYSIVPLLFSNDQKVVFTAADALVELHAFNAIEPLKIAIQKQSPELKPFLRKAEKSLTGYLGGK